MLIVHTTNLFSVRLSILEFVLTVVVVGKPEVLELLNYC